MIVLRQSASTLVAMFLFVPLWINWCLANDGPSADFVAEVRQLRAAKDHDGLRKLGERLKGDWLDRKQSQSLAKISEICGALISMGLDDPGIQEFVYDLAVSVLDSSANKPAEPVLRLLLALSADRDYSTGKVKGDDWLKERRTRIERWLREWKSIRERITALKASSGPFFVQVSPPAETGLPAGASPEAIKDPVLRKRYEEAIKRNSDNANAFRERDDLEAVQQRLAKSAKHYIVEAYCKPPFATEELDAILQRYGVDKSTREGIVAETRRGVAARIERDAQLAKLSPKAGFLDTTPTTGLGADPRLRAKVKANFAAPLAEEVLDVLRKATGVTLTRADDIQNKHYVAGSYSFNDNPAWQVMEMLAASKYVQGKWEADGDGYRLVRNGKPVAEPSPPPKFKSTSAPKAPAKGGPQAPASNFNFWLTVASITAIVLIAVAIGWRRWRNSPPSTPNLPDSTGAQGE